MSEPTKLIKASMRMVPREKINADPQLQIRVGIDPETVTRYREIIKEYGKMDPILLVDVGAEDGRFVVSKGFHRLDAYDAEAVAIIPAGIFKGSLSDAKWHAFEDGHGSLPLTNADKRKAALMAVEDPAIGLREDKDIAKRIGVSESLVREVRAGITPETKREKAEKKKTKREAGNGSGSESNVGQSNTEVTESKPATTSGGGGGSQLSPVTVRQRKPKEEQKLSGLTKAQALRQIVDWTNRSLIEEEDVLAKFAVSAVGKHIFLPNVGDSVKLKLTRGKAVFEIKTTIAEITFGEISLTYTGKEVVRA